ncbi:hypothetical protein C8J57DRAFT_1246631 [Mycena rebaudengoi]|nr:hypothetical protein C8J57DRAFT_1246631 [Mycena rebaudengoi]
MRVGGACGVAARAHAESQPACAYAGRAMLTHTDRKLMRHPCRNAWREGDGKKGQDEDEGRARTAGSQHPGRNRRRHAPPGAGMRPSCIARGQEEIFDAMRVPIFNDKNWAGCMGREEENGGGLRVGRQNHDDVERGWAPALPDRLRLVFACFRPPDENEHGVRSRHARAGHAVHGVRHAGEGSKGLGARARQGAAGGAWRTQLQGAAFPLELDPDVPGDGKSSVRRTTSVWSVNGVVLALLYERHNGYSDAPGMGSRSHERYCAAASFRSAAVMSLPMSSGNIG